MQRFQERKSAHRIPVRVVDKEDDYIEPLKQTDINEPEETEPQLIETVESEPAEPAPETDWETIAKRRQAEMENFRKRQSRRAQEAAAEERERLLQRFLPIVDNLARALDPEIQDYQSLRQGIELTRREFNRILAAEGVTRLETVGEEFDPKWHEALAAIPNQAQSNTIIEEIEPGYKLGDKLLRPAKVIVAA